MKQKVIELFKKSFVKNVTIVATGTGLAQLITIAFAPLITRLYGPEPFGVLGVFLAISAIITPIGSLTYQIAIVLPKKDDDAKTIAILSLIIAAMVSSIFALILVLFRSPIISLLQLEAISSFILMIPVFIFFSVCQQIAEQWIIRTGQFKKKAKVAIANALVLNGTKSGIGLFYPAAIVLVGLTTFGSLLHAFLLGWDPQRKIKKTFHTLRNAPWLNILRIKEIARLYKDFPLFRAPQAFLGYLTSQMPIIILTSFFGPAYAGLYAIGQKVIKSPSGIISASIGKVFYPRISQEFNQGKRISHLLTKTTLGLASIGIIPFGILVLFGPPLFGFIFGNEWVDAGEYARWLSIWLFFDFIRVPSIQTIPVIGIQGFFLFYTLISTVIRVSTLLLTAIITKDDLLTIAYFCGVSSLFSFLIMLIVILKSTKINLITT